MINKQILQLVRTNKGNNLLDLSYQSPVLLVFLRHFGCVYCKESMMDIARKKINFEKTASMLLWYMADYNVAEEYECVFIT
ncbi:MAG: hypothetical protein IPL63_14650 [Saprospiraceae bacterium]|nr:hypothetical protein [Saprospiraceae bacterium]